MENPINKALNRKKWKACRVNIGGVDQGVFEKYTLGTPAFDVNSIVLLEETENKLIGKALSSTSTAIINGIEKRISDEERLITIILEKVD